MGEYIKVANSDSGAGEMLRYWRDTMEMETSNGDGDNWQRRRVLLFQQSVSVSTPYHDGEVHMFSF